MCRDPYWLPAKFLLQNDVDINVQRIAEFAIVVRGGAATGDAVVRKKGKLRWGRTQVSPEFRNFRRGYWIL